MEKITKGHPLTQSPDFIKENIETLKSLFPTIVKEGKIDFEELKLLLDEELETEDEFYRFTWAGKSMARREATKPSTATLRPCKEESKNWDTTQNIFIEGDNLEVLKLLQKSYANKIKMIYIDPPYNTGKDFVYRDDYKDNLGNYLAITNQIDEEGKRKSTNTESDGRFHSNWLNMIYPRLKLAKDIMTNDGVMFISIDDNEVINLFKVCEEIFGEENCEIYIWDVREDGTMPKTAKNTVRKEHEYLLCIFRNESRKKLNKYLSFKYSENGEWGNPDNDPRGPWMSANISRGTGKGTGGSKSFVIKNPLGIEFDRDWSITEDEYNELLNDGRIYFANDGYGVPRKKIFQNESVTSIQSSIFENLKSSQYGKAEINRLIKNLNFDYPKPSTLIKRLIQISTEENSYVLDFFAGSGTTPHAMFMQNSEDGLHRRFICVQLPEYIEGDTDMSKAGFINIAEIAKERIRRAGEKTLNEKQEDLKLLEAKIQGKILQDDIQKQIDELSKIIERLDIGFKVFKLDSSNLITWDGDPEKIEQTLFNAASNIKDNRTESDILYEILLKYGLDLAQPILQRIISGKSVFNIGDGALFICLADGITTNVADEIGKWKDELKPSTCKVIFKDTGFTDVEKTNSMQILKRYGIEEVNTI